MPFVPIGGLVNRSLKRVGVHHQVQTALAIERASKAMTLLLGDEVCEYLRPLYIQRKTLNIASLNASAATYVGRVQTELLEYVNQGLPYPIVERIRIIS